MSFNNTCNNSVVINNNNTNTTTINLNTSGINKYNNNIQTAIPNISDFENKQNLEFLVKK